MIDEIYLEIQACKRLSIMFLQINFVVIIHKYKDDAHVTDAWDT